MNKKPKGSLIIIGGHEDKDGDATILTEVSQRANRGKGSLVIVSVASNLPEEVNSQYVDVFKRLGVRNVEVLDVRTRADAHALTGEPGPLPATPNIPRPGLQALADAEPPETESKAPAAKKKASAAKKKKKASAAKKAARKW